MFAFARVVELEATSADRSVLGAVEHALAHAHLIRDHIPDHVDGTALDVSFASEQWQRIIRDREHPGRLNRRHFEACVFTYLAAELRSGDIAVRGSEAYANWSARLLPWEECEELLGEFCAQAGLPASAEAFTSALRSRLTEQAASVDAGYPENTDLVIDEVTGVPSLRRRRGKDRDAGALLLEQALKQRMPERTLLEILARTAYWLEWWRRFGPASGSDPKLADPLLRYVLTTFTYGANMGPAQAARHIRGVSAHELGATAARHFTTGKLNRASADVVDAYLQLDLVEAWGDASSVAADGTQVDTLIDNLLAESHVRYGGYGGDRVPPRRRQLHRATSSRAACGRPSTSSRGSSRTSPRPSRARSTPTPKARATPCTRSRTCSALSCSPASATGRTSPSTGPPRT
jgi:Tn3 transposase DDE domain-containing protein